MRDDSVNKDKTKSYNHAYYLAHKGKHVGRLLTDRRHKDDLLLAFLRDYRKQHRFSPTLSEMASELEVAKSTIKARMTRLAREGRVAWSAGLSRTARVTGK